jgi:hypothetical protein
VIRALLAALLLLGTLSAATPQAGYPVGPALPLSAANGGAGTINGALKGNGSGTVSQAAAVDLSDTVALTSWTPADASGASLSITTTEAKYYRIGKITGVFFNITYPATGNTNTAIISGLPCNSASAGNVQGSSMIKNVSGFPNVNVLGGTSTIVFTATTTGTGAQNNQLTGANLQGSFVYVCS